jgi:hypothetical protein
VGVGSQIQMEVVGDLLTVKEALEVVPRKEMAALL